MHPIVAQILAFSRSLALAPVPAPPVPTRALPKGRQWNAHTGTRARARYMRQRFARILKLKDPASLTARAAIRDACASDPWPTEAEANIMNAALVEADERRIPWAKAVAQILLELHEGEEKAS